MDDKDLDPYSTTRGDGWGAVARGLARTIGVVLGCGISLFGVASFALRCFDTCPADPAQDKIGVLYAVSLVLAGIGVVVASASAGAPWSRTGWRIVSVLGAAVVLCGVAVAALVPQMDTPGAHSGSTRAGILMISAGGLGAGAGHVLAGRSQPGGPDAAR